MNSLQFCYYIFSRAIYSNKFFSNRFYMLLRRAVFPVRFSGEQSSASMDFDFLNITETINFFVKIRGYKFVIHSRILTSAAGFFSNLSNLFFLNKTLSLLLNRVNGGGTPRENLIYTVNKKVHKTGERMCFKKEKNSFGSIEISLRIEWLAKNA